jgi:hypothetical protein
LSPHYEPVVARQRRQVRFIGLLGQSRSAVSRATPKAMALARPTDRRPAVKAMSAGLEQEKDAKGRRHYVDQQRDRQLRPS